MAQYCCRSIVHHVFLGCRELAVALYNFIDGVEQILLRDSLSPGSDGVHASLSTHRPVCGGGETAKWLKLILPAPALAKGPSPASRPSLNGGESQFSWHAAHRAKNIFCKNFAKRVMRNAGQRILPEGGRFCPPT